MADIKDDIEKYLSGELSPDEMHALEKEALGNPFLSEAIEGASSIPVDDFGKDVIALNQRVRNRKITRSRWYPLRVAATIILLIGVSYFIYNFFEQQDPVKIADTSPKKMAEPPTKGVSDSLPPKENGKSKQELLSLNQPAPARRKETAKASPRLPDISKPALVVGDEKADAGQAASKDQVHELQVTETESDETSVGKGDLADKKEIESVAKPNAKDHAKLDAARSSYAAGAAVAHSTQKIISGRVTSTDDGTPIPGATVQIQGTNLGTVSDIEGNYQVIAQTPQDSLVISSLGYLTREVKIPLDNSKVNVSLPIDATQLNEVVVVGYGPTERVSDDDVPIQLAEPLGGKRAYKKYLETRLQYPQEALFQKIEGKVTIEFNVGTVGDLSDFKVLRGIGYGCNEEVIRLVKDGPAWKPSSQGKVKLESTVRVRVKFKLPK